MSQIGPSVVVIDSEKISIEARPWQRPPSVLCSACSWQRQVDRRRRRRQATLEIWSTCLCSSQPHSPMTTTESIKAQTRADEISNEQRRRKQTLERAKANHVSLSLAIGGTQCVNGISTVDAATANAITICETQSRAWMGASLLDSHALGTNQITL